VAPCGDAVHTVELPASHLKEMIENTTLPPRLMTPAACSTRRSLRWGSGSTCAVWPLIGLPRCYGTLRAIAIAICGGRCPSTTIALGKASSHPLPRYWVESYHPPLMPEDMPKSAPDPPPTTSEREETDDV